MASTSLPLPLKGRRGPVQNARQHCACAAVAVCVCVCALSCACRGTYLRVAASAPRRLPSDHLRTQTLMLDAPNTTRRSWRSCSAARRWCRRS